ncbi:FHA domain-containing protein [Streptomyces bambusae]|uniref:FHA domain-containing protein n=1 Tax=Streptomyces bambusae TaxID=1550616 RepID=A0ABS6ZD67_9ACTN|nr:FHA domain-containing protein [Streptomyces bambusae]MBW5485710.1 FHA domain-containing protein [Streptomyces bambusae]
MPTCPNGHRSVADDWCEVCGHRMAPTGAPAAEQAPAAPSYGYGYPPSAGLPTMQTELCPQCRTPREDLAPFCEECRYNFPAGPAAAPAGAASPYAPPPPPPAPAPQGRPEGYGPEGYGEAADPFGYQGSRPSQINRPAEPLPREDDWLLQPPSQPSQPSHASRPAPPQPYAQHSAPVAPPAPSLPRQHGTWTATIGPDREYFLAMMQRSGPEAAGLDLPAYSPEQHLVLSGGQITIGRSRASKAEVPDIDLSVPPEDPGVSHRHAVLVQQPDGSWAVVDQNSTNGTTVNGGEDPIQPYVPVPLADGDRVHVGAWTTITVRRGRS